MAAANRGQHEPEQDARGYICAGFNHPPGQYQGPSGVSGLALIMLSSLPIPPPQ